MHYGIALRGIIGVEVPSLISGIAGLDVGPKLSLDRAPSFRHLLREYQELVLVLARANIDRSVASLHKAAVHSLGSRQGPKRKHLVHPRIPHEEMAHLATCRTVHLAVPAVRHERGDRRGVRRYLRCARIA